MFKSLPLRKVSTAPPSAPAPAPRADPERVLRRLEWTVIRRLDGQLQGDYRTLFRGFGIDLADLREYQPHDDVRYIDWNVTARLQTPHVREFQEDREVAAWFLLDLSGSIDFGSLAVRKRVLSSELVTVLARLLTRHGNRVGAVLCRGESGGADEVIPARAGRRHVLHLLNQMLIPAPERGTETDLTGFIAAAQQVIKRRSVVFIISDFISKPGWGRALALLARRHEVIAVRLYDSLEVELPDLGLVVLQDAETGEQMFIDTHDRGFRKRFAEAAAARETALREVLSGAGIDCLELATDDPLDEALLRFTRLRKRRSQLAAGGGLYKPPAR
ncbi:MAG: DUF58 domain-containing protein [Betaproteobacteria bacterium]|nr:DUF58 domain-containing protein [Betaproteobacteria bacterium]